MNSNAAESIIYLDVNDLYNINEQVTDGRVFVRDRHILRSAVQRPRIRLFGEAQFPTLLDKAGAIMHAVAHHHIFADGNKRTAEIATRMFLEANGVTVTWTPDDARPMLLAIARGELEPDQITTWLAEHTE